MASLQASLEACGKQHDSPGAGPGLVDQAPSLRLQRRSDDTLELHGGAPQPRHLRFSVRVLQLTTHDLATDAQMHPLNSDELRHLSQFANDLQRLVSGRGDTLPCDELEAAREEEPLALTRTTTPAEDETNTVATPTEHDSVRPKVKTLTDEEEKLRAMFLDFDKDGGGGITAEDIAFWSSHQTSNVTEPMAKPIIEHTIEAINRKMGIKIVEPDKPSHITFDTFRYLMSNDFRSEGNERALGQEIYEYALEIREVLLRYCERQARFTVVMTEAGMNEADMRIFDAKEGYERSIQGIIERWMEAVISFVIVTNAFVLGLSVDYPDWEFWLAVESVFVVIYVCEILLKFRMHSVLRFFRGPDWHWNFFDFIIVMCSLFDLIISVLARSSALDNLVIMRVIRLLRLARILRVIRFKFLAELNMMINGVISGLRVLFWALIMLSIVIYVIGLAVRISIADWKPPLSPCGAPQFNGSGCSRVEAQLEKHHDTLFGSVPKTMFTVFRCYVDGCSSADGTPLMLQIWEVHGGLFPIMYVLSVFVVVFGVFNVMTAIVVEQMSAFALSEKYRKAESFRAAKSLHAFVLKILDIEPPQIRQRWNPFGNSSQATDEARKTIAIKNAYRTITRDAFQNRMDDPEIIGLLEDIGVTSACRYNLFEVLDADCSEKLEAVEIVRGLLKLRGVADKSDMVAALLGVRACQQQLKDMHSLMKQSHAVLRTSFTAQAKHAKQSRDAGNRRKKNMTHTVTTDRLKLDANGLHVTEKSDARSNETLQDIFI